MGSGTRPWVSSTSRQPTPQRELTVCTAPEESGGFSAWPLLLGQVRSIYDFMLKLPRRWRELVKSLRNYDYCLTKNKRCVLSEALPILSLCFSKYIFFSFIFLLSYSFICNSATPNGSAVCYDSWCTQYPFSVKPDSNLSAADVMTMLRDHYEGTPYDLTKGLQSGIFVYLSLEYEFRNKSKYLNNFEGPYGDPNRWDAANSTFNMTEIQVLNGSFERPISMFRTSTSILAQAR